MNWTELNLWQSSKSKYFSKIVCSINSAGKPDIHMQKYESRHRHFTCQKIKSNWITNLNVRGKNKTPLKDRRKPT